MSSGLERIHAGQALTLASLQEVEAQRNAAQQQNADLKNLMAGLDSELEGIRAEQMLTSTTLGEVEAQRNAAQQQNADLKNLLAGLGSELEGIRAEQTLTSTNLRELETQRYAVQQENAELKNVVGVVSLRLGLALATVQEVEAQRDRREMEYRGVIDSTSWRITAVLRKLGEGAPWFAATSRRLLKHLLRVPPDR